MKDVAVGGGGAMAFGPGPKVTGAAGIGMGLGTGKDFGSGGSGSGFGGRGSGHRKAMLATGGGTKHTERAVTAALVWLANHQLSDGSWSLQNFTQRCKCDKTCTGTGEITADAGATAMGLLPFLAAGQTHKSKGPYKDHILNGISWLMTHQQPDGNLAKGGAQMMYSHGLATIALSEAYGLSGDEQVGQAAQGAVNFILNAQNTARRRLAVQSRRSRRHLRGRLAVDGPEERPHGRPERRQRRQRSAFSGTSKWLDSVRRERWHRVWLPARPRVRRTR